MEFDKKTSKVKVNGFERRVYGLDHNKTKKVFGLNCGIEQFIKIAKERNETPSFLIKDVELNPFKHERMFVFRAKNLKKRKDDIDISDDDLVALFNEILVVFRNPELVFRCLGGLEEDLSNELRENNVVLEKKQPQYLVTGPGYYVPGVWPEDYVPSVKNKLLEKVLLKREQATGLNVAGVGVFDGLVAGKEVGKFMRFGNMFKENVREGIFLLHGKNSHRLALEIIREAVRLGFVDSRGIDDGEVFRLLSGTFFSQGISGDFPAWVLAFDMVSDTSLVCRGGDVFDDESYSFSACSPFVLNSLLLCFAQDELPNLNSYLLDAHYKYFAQRIAEVEKIESGIDRRDLFLYLTRAQFDGVGFYEAGNLRGNSFLQMDGEKYEEFSEEFDDKIKRKKPSETLKKPYVSVQDYIESYKTI